MRTRSLNTLAASAAALITLTAPMAVLAQGPGGFGGPGMNPSPPRNITPATIPVDVMASALKLTGEQKTNICAIAAQLDKERVALAPQPMFRPMSGPFGPGPGQRGPGPGGFGNPGPTQDTGPQGFPDAGSGAPGQGGPGQNAAQPDFIPARPGGWMGGPPRGFARMEASQDELQDLSADASDRIVALLSASQQSELVKLERKLRDLQLAGISPKVYATLALTPDQTAKIVALADAQRAAVVNAIDSSQDPAELQSSLQQMRSGLRSDVMALLDADQVRQVQEDTPAPGGGPIGVNPQGGPVWQSPQGGPNGNGPQGGPWQQPGQDGQYPPPSPEP